MFGKVYDGASMIWASLDERERLLAIWLGLALVGIVLGALTRKDDEAAVLPAAPQPVVIVLREQ
jgi:hypothetical protein